MSGGASSSCFNPAGLDVSATRLIVDRASSASDRYLGAARKELQFFYERTAEGGGLGLGQPEAMRAGNALQINKRGHMYAF